MMQDLQLSGAGDSTNDIAHLLGMLDPWYERNTLSLLDLPANIVCQVRVGFHFPLFLQDKNANSELTNVSLNSALLTFCSCNDRKCSYLIAHYILQQTSKTESDSYDDSYEQRLPILADLVLYYCRYASSPTLIQLYQAEVRPISTFLHKKHTSTISNNVSQLLNSATRFLNLHIFVRSCR